MLHMFCKDRVRRGRTGKVLLLIDLTTVGVAERTGRRIAV
jgi:hypothetical protein